MKYFIDTEFIEGFIKPFLGKRRHFIDLISIGIVAEDGRSYYAISNEFKPKLANDWVKKNVIAKLESKVVFRKDMIMGDIYPFPNPVWKSNADIANDICRFVGMEPFDDGFGLHWGFRNGVEKPEFYAYYGDYDWVVFCSLFGSMMDLPNGFPMYCRDIKQMLDEEVMEHERILSIRPELSFQDACAKRLEAIKKDPDYPKETNEHNALDDARWNKKLYDYVQFLKEERARPDTSPYRPKLIETPDLNSEDLD